MRIIIDTEKNLVVVPNTFFKTIDKINQNIELGGGTQVEYVDYIKGQFEKAIENPVKRKADL